MIQLIAILFAIALAKHDAPAVDNMEHFGVLSKKSLDRFHIYNSITKFFFCLGVALPFYPIIWDALFVGFISFLWIYLIFDIVLNLSRKITKRKWDYLGENDLDGRRWIKWFGVKAGKMKALILSSLIIVLNLLKYLL